MKIYFPSISRFQQLVELKSRKASPRDGNYRPATCVKGCVPRGSPDRVSGAFTRFLRQHKHYKAPAMKAAKYSLMAFFLDCVKVQGWSVFKEICLPPHFQRGSQVQTPIAAFIRAG